MGIRLMDSTPPARITSPCPAMMRSAAMAMDCSPEEQKRLMVIADASTGRPARIDAMRATFIPCSASGIAQPRITSSISFGSRPGTRAIASRITVAAKSSGRAARSAPLNALPTAVRTELTITASLMLHLENNHVRICCACPCYWTPRDEKKQQRRGALSSFARRERDMTIGRPKKASAQKRNTEVRDEATTSRKISRIEILRYRVLKSEKQIPHTVRRQRDRVRDDKRGIAAASYGCESGLGRWL